VTTIRKHSIRMFIADTIRRAKEGGLSWREGRAAMRAARYAMKEIDESRPMTDFRLEQIIDGAIVLENKVAAGEQAGSQ
jgi:hypothetical protein